MKTCQHLIVGVAVVCGLGAAAHGQTVLQFNGTNQYVTMGTASGLGAATFTIECWFKRSSSSSAGAATVTGGNGFNGNFVPLVSKGRGEAEGSNVDTNYILGLHLTSNVLIADFEEGAGGALLGLNHPVCGSTAVTDTNWHHAAATYSAAGGWSLYLDGVAQTVGTACSNCQTSSPNNCTTTPGATPRSDSIQHFGVATALTSGGVADGFFNGRIDEVRVWSVVRTGSEIASGMNQEITSGSGLIGRWGFNEGSGTTTADSTTPAETGTLTNGPTWVAGGPALYNELNWTFQQGVAGYSGAVDTYIHVGAATTDFATAVLLSADGIPPPEDERQVLIRFDGIFGSNPGQIPTGTTISSATLTVNVSNAYLLVDNVKFHRMKQTWNASNTWTTFGASPWNATAGIQADNVEAVAAADVTINNIPLGLQSIPVTTSLQAWAAAPASNFGWVLRVDTADTFAFDSSEVTTAGNRPKLTVVALVPKNAPPNQPTLVAPANGASGQSTSPTLTVNVTDAESNPMTVTFFGRLNTVPPPGPDFTIIALPDTQFYSCGSTCGSNTAIFGSQLQWIVDNRASRNIAFVTQLGDCTEHGNDGNVNGANAEWDVANSAFSLIESFANTGLTYGIPFGIAVGNHDQTPANSPRSGGDEGATTVRYNNTFGVSRFTGRPYYGGRYDFGAPATYPNNNDNHYELFSAGGMDFIIIHFEYDDAPNATRTAAISWANGLLQANSNRRGIVVSHWIINNNAGATFGDQGQAIYDGLKGNANLFLMLSGHLDQGAFVGRRSDTFGGNTVHSLLSDYQTGTLGGNGYLRILTFSPANNTIDVKSYSPWLNAYLTDSTNQFVLSYTMSGTPPAFSQIGSPVTGVASGSNASVVWSGLNANTTYEWKTTVSDGTSTTNGPTWSFGTTCTDNASCNDGNPCTDDVCDNGSCTHTNNTSSCSDGLACTTNDVCNGGVCAGTPVSCPGGSSCNPTSGQCAFPPVTVTFQQGVSSYSGAVDTYINAADLTPHAAAAALTIDVSPGPQQGLLKFGSLFASEGGPIPAGATITSATLQLNITNTTDSAIGFHPMLQSWADSALYSTFGSSPWNTTAGIQVDNVEAATATDASRTFPATGLQTVDVTARFQAWAANPATNYGWVVNETADNSLVFDSAEGTTPGNRPKLTVTYVPPPPCNTNADCNDNNACTDNVCSAGICTFPAISCSDGNACTADSCNPASGCVHTAITCNDNSPCTDDSCNPATGCVYTPVDCADTDPCTADSCQPPNLAAVSLNGSGQYVDLGTGAAVTNFGTGSFTFEGWFRVPSINAGANMSIFRMGRSGTNPVATIQVVANSTTIQASVEANTAPTGSQSDTAAIGFSLSAWTHFAVVVDRTTAGNQRLKLYVNGALPSGADVGPATWGTSAISSADATVLGANRADTGALTATYNGAIDEVRIWNTARTLSEIQANMNIQLVSASGLVARWGLNEGTGTSAADSVGGNNGTLAGGATWVTGAGNLVNMGAGGCVHAPIANCCTSQPQCDDGNPCTTDACDNNQCTHTAVSCPQGQTCNQSSGQCESVPVNLTFQQGVASYNGTQDTYLDEVAPGTARGGLDTWRWDTEDPAPNRQFGLVRFDNIFGSGAGQIPAGATIQSATLTLVSFNETVVPAGAINEVAVDWSQLTTTWNIFGGNAGVQSNEYRASPQYTAPLFTGAAAATPIAANINVTASLQSWISNPALNFGWVFRPNSSDGCQVYSAEAVTATNRPKLSVTYTLPECQIGTDCDDSNACTDDTCNAGACVHTPTNCNDNSSCTTDSCNPATGCVHAPISCDDANACTADACNPATGCTHTAISCDDSNPCTDDSCNPASGCQHVNNTETCDDGNACTINDTCSGGACIGTPIACDDNNACTVDTCNPANGCVYTPINCDDANACTADACNPATGCTHNAISCDDSNPCTDDSCNPGSGCQHVDNTETCDDDNACTTNDTCSGGECSGATVDCDDGNACTVDTCNPITGCVHTPLNCNDGNACTSDGCDPESGCTHTPLGCNDSNPCTDDTCNPTSGCEYAAVKDGTSCADPTYCNGVETCQDGFCMPGTPVPNCCEVDADCADTNPCTSEACVEHTCQITNTNDSCNDGNACTTNDQCSGGACVGTPIVCNDSDACTADTCNPATGCVYTPIACSDSNACTEDTCNPATGCVYTPLSCDDGNACTVDACDSESGCTHTPIACNDNNACTGDTCNPLTGCVYTPISCDDGDACTADTCSIENGCAHTPITCNDNNPCTDDSCSPASGCQYVNNAESCDDGNACTANDTCVDGSCQGATVVCDDKDACTADTCNPATGCVHAPISCDDANACTADACNPATGCTHNAISCDDSNACTDDSCNPASGCQHVDNTETCDDGDACTEKDTCSGGECSGTPIVCNDNDACTADTCNPTTGCVYAPISCDDGNPCTNDACVGGTCQNTPIASCNQLSLAIVGSTQICAGESLDVALNVVGLQAPINGVQVLFQYEPTRLALSSISVGDGSTSPWNSAMPSYFSDTGGAVVYSLVLIGAGTSADARVVTLHFTALNPGSSSSPTTVAFRPDQGEFQTKLTTSANVVILPSKLNASPVTVGPQIQVSLQIEGLTHAVTRDVTFVLTDCQHLSPPQVVTRAVAFTASGTGSVLLTGIGASAEWISAFEGHTLSHKLPLGFGGTCFTSVSFTGADRLVAGDLHTAGVPQDNLVDIVDFAILVSRFGTAVSDCGVGPAPQNCSLGADITGDGVQETADFNAIQINFFRAGDEADACPLFVQGPGGSKPQWDIEPIGQEAKSVVRVGDLSRAGPSIARADLNGDGKIDAVDIRAFAAQNRLSLMPAFDKKLKQLEGLSVGR